MKSMIRGVFLALLSASLLAGCASPRKAEALRAGAIQFKVESLAAIDAIDDMRRKEIAPPPRTSAEATADFVAKIKGGTGIVNPTKLSALLEPHAVDLTPDAEKAWSDFLANMRAQYTAFADIYARLPQGSLLAVDRVEESGAYARKLTVQMAAFAKAIDDDPPRLVQHRADIAAKLTKLRRSGISTPDQERQAAELQERAARLLQDEADLRRSVVEQTVKAAVLGQSVQRLIDEYDEISVADMQYWVAVALDAAGQVGGDDLKGLRARADGILVKMENDPVWAPAAEVALTEVNAALASRK